MLALARAAGITVPENRLIDVTEIHGLPPDVGTLKGKALAVERFDRAADGTRIHMEDFAQVFGRYPDKKYEHASYANIAAVLWAEVGEAGTFEFVRRLAFTVLIGNADMHLKNWTLLYHDGRTPALSPAYDLVATLAYIPQDELALSFGGSKDLSRITADQVRRFSDTARLPTSVVAHHIAETAERTVEAWKALPEKELLPNDVRRVVDDHITSVARGLDWSGNPTSGFGEKHG